MYHDSSLKEKVSHGTARRPIAGIHFDTEKDNISPGPFTVERHWHDTVEILHIVKGEFSFEINLENYLLKAGDICFLNPEDLHQITGHGPSTIHDVLIFDPRILDFTYPDELEEETVAPFLARARNLPHVIHPENAGYRTILTLFQRLSALTSEKPSGWYILCKLTLLGLFHAMSENQLFVTAQASMSASDKIKIDRYKKLVSYIEAHYPEPVTLEELGSVVSCNTQYLCHFFKEITGTSPIQYLIGVRLEHACSLLLETEKPILEIGLDCGFDNASYFIRKFRQRKGCTPKEYRRNGYSLP